MSEERAARRAERKSAKAEKKAARVEKKAVKAVAREEKRAERDRAREARQAARDEGPRTPGNQFWRDRLVVDDWRIQEHVRFGRVRVVNPRDRRVHTGTSYDEACSVLREAVSEPSQKGSHLVVFLHGYGGNKSRMSELRDAARAVGLIAEIVQYPSLFRTIDEIADGLTGLITTSAHFHQQRVKKVSLVAFSMGGLVASSVVEKLTNHKASPAFGRLVTIGTPHRGSPIADLFAWGTPLGGPNVVELTERNRRALESLKALPLELGVVGARGVRNGWTMLRKLGDGDGVVPFDSAVIDGATDRLVIEKVKHTSLPTNAEVIRGVISFLTAGRFAGVSTHRESP